MTNFHEHKIEDEEFKSPPFYTSPDGYKMCLEVYANGESDGRGTHVSVYACLMKGDNDDSLTWPFTGKVSFELLNQLEDKNHVLVTAKFKKSEEVNKRVMKDELGKGGGISRFVSHETLDYQSDKNCQYLKDDTLIFRVSVQVPSKDHRMEGSNKRMLI